jgi:hypothetical protein
VAMLAAGPRMTLCAAAIYMTWPLCLRCACLALQSGCAGGGNDPKPPPGLLGASGNDTKYR